MRLNNRALAIVSASLMWSLAGAPAHAAPATLNYAGLHLPDGVTIVGTPVVVFDSSTDATRGCFEFDYTGDATTLFFHDILVNSNRMGGNFDAARQVFPVPSQGSGLEDGACIPLAEGDTTDTGATYVVTNTAAATTLADPSNLSFPDAFETITDKLTSLGLTVTSAVMVPLPDGATGMTYHFFVDFAAPNQEADSRLLTIAQPRLITSDENFVALTPAVTMLPLSELNEVDFGFTTDDPEVGLGALQLDADVNVLVPSTFTSTATLPSGLAFSAEPSQWFHPENGGTTVTDVQLSNSTNKPISVSIKSAKLFSVVDEIATDLGVGTAPVQYVTVPANGSASVRPFSTDVSDDVRFGFALSFTATVSLVSPSRWDVKSLALPKGIAVLPLDLNAMGYDSKSKTTSVEVVFKQPIKSKPAVLLWSKGVIAGQKQDQDVADGIRPDANFRYYYFLFDGIKGDTRVDKVLKLAGTVTAETPTKLTQSIKLDKAIDGVQISRESDRPATWNYDAKKKTTLISVMVENNTDSKVRLGNCTLTLTVAGRKVPVVKSNSTIFPQWYGFVNVATVPGDLRFGGTAVVLGGKLKVGGC